MDIFFEQIIKKKKSASEIATLVLLYLVGWLLGMAILLVFFTRFTSFFMFGVMLAIGVFYGTIKLGGHFNVEYEYSVTNGCLDIDKIINRNRRERMVSLNLPDAEEFGAYDDSKLQNRNLDLKVTALGDSSSGDEIYYICTRLPAKGRTMVIFQPNERILDATEKSLPRQLRAQFEREKRVK